MAAKVRLRPITDKDRDFLYDLYASTRADEMALLVDWDADQKKGFLEMQFNAQHTYYHQEFPDAAYDVVMLGSRRIGRLYVHRRPDEIRVIDIALIPSYRNKGIGAAMMRSILAEGQKANLPVRIHVERFNNPAMHLYVRLGFRAIGDQGVYFLMEWTPDTARE
jgi:ribosomal protein S18 acetylase RimI-like enzyme